MNPTFKHALQTAAQLTAAGDLRAATAAIQQALAGNPAPVPTGRRGPASFDAQPDGRPFDDVIDVEGRWRDESPHQAGSETGPIQAGLPPAGLTPAGRMQAGSFSNHAGRREYLLYRPHALESATRAPALVIMLHGCTQTPADFAAGTAMNALADRHGFVVLYPGQSRSANQSSCWNWFNPQDQRAGMGEPAIIAGMAREIAARNRVDPGRIFAAGLSAGGAMAAILADAYPDLVDAVAVHSGLRAGAAHDLPSALAAMKRGAAGAPAAPVAPAATARANPVRTFVIHGRQDRTVHPGNGAQVAEAALAAWPAGSLDRREESGRSPGGRSYLRTIHADARGRPMVERWEVQGAGHAWSGGSALGSHTDPKGPDASAAMIDFFLAHMD